MINPVRYMTIKEAARMLGVSVVTARKKLGVPDRIISTKSKRPKYEYKAKHVEEVKARLNARKKVKKGDICRVCHCGYSKDELKGGRCDLCRARFCVLNFCRRDCKSCQNGADCGLLLCLKKAINAIERKEGKKND